MRWRRLQTFLHDKVLINWQLRLAALAAAFVIWGYVAGQQSMQAVFSVPVYFQNLPTGMVMTKQKVNRVEVTISGRRDRILSLKERQIWVAIDLHGMKAGANVYRITQRDLVAPYGIEVKVITPRKLTIHLAQEKITP